MLLDRRNVFFFVDGVGGEEVIYEKQNDAADEHDDGDGEKAVHHFINVLF